MPHGHGHHGRMVAAQFGKEIFNPETPVNVEVNGFRDGQRLRCVLIPTKNRFAINLKTPNDNAFHFNPRFDERAVVRNSTHHGSWQREERFDKEFPFQTGRIYTLEFVAQHGQVEVLINGRPYCQFKERHSHDQVNLITVDGDVHVHSIHIVN